MSYTPTSTYMNGTSPRHPNHNDHFPSSDLSINPTEEGDYSLHPQSLPSHGTSTNHPEGYPTSSNNPGAQQAAEVYPSPVLSLSSSRRRHTMQVGTEDVITKDMVYDRFPWHLHSGKSSVVHLDERNARNNGLDVQIATRRYASPLLHLPRRHNVLGIPVVPGDTLEGDHCDNNFVPFNHGTDAALFSERQPISGPSMFRLEETAADKDAYSAQVACPTPTQHIIRGSSSEELSSPNQHKHILSQKEPRRSPSGTKLDPMRNPLNGAFGVVHYIVRRTKPIA
jgi:hypothetical protein